MRLPREDRSANKGVEEGPRETNQTAKRADVVASIKSPNQQRLSGDALKPDQPPREEKQSESPDQGTSQRKGFHVQFHFFSFRKSYRAVYDSDPRDRALKFFVYFHGDGISEH